MTLILSGTNGLSDVDGSASTPAIRGTDSNTGIFFPAADTIAFAEGGAEAMRIDSAGNLLVGATSNTDQSGTFGQTIRGPAPGLTFVGTEASARTYTIYEDTGSLRIYDRNAAAERARIDSSGNLLVGTTSAGGTAGVSIMPNNSNGAATIYWDRANTASTSTALNFENNNATVGSVTYTNTATAYNTSSDYRLKHDIAPMTGALTRVAALKPVTYKWNVDNSAGEGFIAHELQAVVPDAVTGEKDAVDVEGNPVYQGIDTSFLVATLTAAIQEQQALIESLTARIAALEAA